MNKKILVLAAIILIVICAARIILCGSTYVLSYEMGSNGDSADDFELTDDENGKVVKLAGVWEDNGYLKVKYESVAKGSTLVSISGKDGVGYSEMMYVHAFGVITSGSFFGYSTGSRIIPAACALYILLLLFMLIRKYRKNVREDMYRYRNVLELGLIVYLFFIFWTQFMIMMVYHGLDNSIDNLIHSAELFATIMLPVAFVLSILISLSNLRLMMKEGRSWRNMLGFILGLVLLTGTILPIVIGDILQQTTLVDVHNELGAGHMIELTVDSCIYAVIAYLECILVGTILFGIKSARHIPEFNKDYILILGCAIRKDGTPTPLLQSRADRAVEFAEMQKNSSGRDIKFVPSGGKGPDEVISEAESITRYLVSRGIPEEKILPENKSKNTYENIRNSMELIREDFDGKSPEAAFSTTNYHVFRSGSIASRQGYKLEGIGSRTKSYFWINAFIREYIAMLAEEKKAHIMIIAGITAIILVMVSIYYFSLTM